MYSLATKNFGVWKSGRKENQKFYYLASLYFLVSLSIVAFIIFLTLVVLTKTRQEFFLIESSSISMYKNKNIKKEFLIHERTSALTVFAKVDNHGLLHIYFENGDHYILPEQYDQFKNHLDKTKRDIVYLSMFSRMNKEENSRIKIFTEENTTFEHIQAIIKIFSQYGFDSFDFGVEQ